MKIRMRMWMAPRPIAEAMAKRLGEKVAVPWTDFEVAARDADKIQQSRAIRYIRYDGLPVPMSNQ